MRCKAVRLLLTLVLGRGALRYILEVVQMLLTAGRCPPWQDVRIAVHPLLAQLSQYRNFADLTPVVFSEDTGKWDLKALPCPQKEEEGQVRSCRGGVLHWSAGWRVVCLVDYFCSCLGKCKQWIW